MADRDEVVIEVKSDTSAEFLPSHQDAGDGRSSDYSEPQSARSQGGGVPPVSPRAGSRSRQPQMAGHDSASAASFLQRSAISAVGKFSHSLKSLRSRASRASSRTGSHGKEGGEADSEGQGEEEEEDDDLLFDIVACGNSYTMMVTLEDRKLLACGNHRNGQLGIDRPAEEDIVLCEQCEVLEAQWYCAQCEREQQHLDKTLQKNKTCNACKQTIHLPKRMRSHEPTRIPKPDSRLYQPTPEGVVFGGHWEPPIEAGGGSALPTPIGRTRSGEGNPDPSEEEEAMSIGAPQSAFELPVVELDQVVAVKCGDAHTLALVENEQLDGTDESDGDFVDSGKMETPQVPRSRSASGRDSIGSALPSARATSVGRSGPCMLYAWGSTGYGRTGLFQQDEKGGGKRAGRVQVEDDQIPELEDQFRAVPVMQRFLKDPMARKWLPVKLSRGLWQRPAGDDHDSDYTSSSSSSADDERWRNPDDSDDEDKYTLDFDEYEAQPRPIRAEQIACGGRHSLGTRNGRVYSFGDNSNGQLGRRARHKGARFCPFWTGVVLPPSSAEEKVVMIACGNDHSLALTDTGTVYSWGCSRNGRLGYIVTGDRNQKAPRMVVLKTEAGETVRSMVQSIACGSKHSAAVSLSGQRHMLWAWGQNECGQCGPFPLPRDALSQVDEGAPHWRSPDVSYPREVALPVEIIDDDPDDARLEPEPELGTMSGRASARDRTMQSRRESAMSVPRSRMAATISMSKRSATPRTAGDVTSRTKTSGAGTHKSERPPNKYMVACGECHTLALLGEHLFLLGSGLDRQPRLDNVFIKKRGRKKEVELEPCFRPRKIEWAFTDTAEIRGRSTKPTDDDLVDREHDPTWPVYGYKIDKKYDPDDPEAPPTIKYLHFMIFTIGEEADIELEATDTEGPIVAFTGPRAPSGLRMESASEGPWFTAYPGTIAPCTYDYTFPSRHKEPGWLSKKDSKRFTIQVEEKILSSEHPTFEAMASWIANNVTETDTSNMLVCVKKELPHLKQIASGSFHAAALTARGQVLTWGKGGLGRLGFGNELDQMIPTALELGDEDEEEDGEEEEVGEEGEEGGSVHASSDKVSAQASARPSARASAKG